MFCSRTLAPLLAFGKGQCRSAAVESCPAWLAVGMNQRSVCSVPSADEGAETKPIRLPWVPTKDLDKKKDYFKRMDHLRRMIEEERSEAILSTKNYPKFRPGDIVKLKIIVPENKKKEEIFTGVCMAVNQKSIRTTFTLRKTFSANVIVERTFPLHSPNILEITVTGRRRKVRQAKPNYLKERPKETQV